jgi:hypothetical protein
MLQELSDDNIGAALMFPARSPDSVTSRACGHDSILRVRALTPQRTIHLSAVGEHGIRAYRDVGITPLHLLGQLSKPDVA